MQFEKEFNEWIKHPFIKIPDSERPKAYKAFMFFVMNMKMQMSKYSKDFLWEQYKSYLTNGMYDNKCILSFIEDSIRKVNPPSMGITIEDYYMSTRGLNDIEKLKLFHIKAHVDNTQNQFDST